MRFLRYLFRVKYRALRLSPWVVLYTAVKVSVDNPPDVWFILIAGVLLLIIYRVETVVGISAELDESWGKSKEWQDFKRVDAEFKQAIREKLDI